MSRLAISENIRRMRAEEARDPVDRAFSALAALSDDQRQALAAQFNAVFGKCVPPSRMTIHKAEG